MGFKLKETFESGGSVAVVFCVHYEYLEDGSDMRPQTSNTPPIIIEFIKWNPADLSFTVWLPTLLTFM